MITSSLISTKLVLRVIFPRARDSNLAHHSNILEWWFQFLTSPHFGDSHCHMNFLLFQWCRSHFSHLQYLPASKCSKLSKCSSEAFLQHCFECLFHLGKLEWQFSIDEEVCFANLLSPPKVLATYQLLSAGMLCVLLLLSNIFSNLYSLQNIHWSGWSIRVNKIVWLVLSAMSNRFSSDVISSSLFWISCVCFSHLQYLPPCWNIHQWLWQLSSIVYLPVCLILC